ncbi:MAG TPA: hypothetical protein VGE21_15190 [Flavobacteriales bacterium]
MNDFNAAGPAPARPTMLTVICVLSFIAGLIGIYSGISSAFTDSPQKGYEQIQAQVEEQRSDMGDQGAMMEGVWASMLDVGQRSVTHKAPIGYSGIALSLLSLLGVWMMWNLKKTGFWIYLLATLGGLITPLIWLGSSMVALLTLGFAGLISIVFVILYAVNLKHMR